MEKMIQLSKGAFYASCSLFLLVISVGMIRDFSSKRPPMLERLGRYAVDQTFATVRHKDGAFVAKLITRLRPRPGQRKPQKNQVKTLEMTERLGRYAVDSLLKTATDKQGALLVGIVKQLGQNQAEARRKRKPNPALQKTLLALGKHLIEQVMVLAKKDDGLFVRKLVSELRPRRTAQDRAAQQAAMRAMLGDVLKVAAKRIVDIGTADDAKLVIKVLQSMRPSEQARAISKARNQKNMAKMLGGVLKYTVNRLMKKEALGGLLKEIRDLIRDARKDLWPNVIVAVREAAGKAIRESALNKVRKADARSARRVETGRIADALRSREKTIWRVFRRKFRCAKIPLFRRRWLLVKGPSHMKVLIRWKNNCFRPSNRCYTARTQAIAMLKRKVRDVWPGLKRVELLGACPLR